MTKTTKIVELSVPSEALFTNTFCGSYHELEPPSLAQPSNPHCPFFFRTLLCVLSPRSDPYGYVNSLIVDVYIRRPLQEEVSSR